MGVSMKSRSSSVIRRAALGLLLACLPLATGCGEESEGKADGPGGGHGGPGGGFPAWGVAPGEQTAAVPVEVLPVERRPISTYIETNGALEAENEVDIVARIAGLVVQLAAEEGMLSGKGQLLARIDEAETRAQVEIAEVRLRDAQRFTCLDGC